MTDSSFKVHYYMTCYPGWPHPIGDHPCRPAAPQHIGAPEKRSREGLIEAYMYQSDTSRNPHEFIQQIIHFKDLAEVS